MEAPTAAPAYAVTKVRAGVHPDTDEWVLEADVVENGQPATVVRTGLYPRDLANDFVDEYQPQYAFLPEAWTAIHRIQDATPVDSAGIDYADAYPDEDELPPVHSMPELLDQLVDVAAQGNAPGGEEAAKLVESWFGVQIVGEHPATGEEQVFGTFRFAEITTAYVTGWDTAPDGDEESRVERFIAYRVDNHWAVEGHERVFERISILPASISI